MPTLYVTEPGARLEKEYQRLLVTRDDEVLMAVPFAHVSEVVLVGRAGATTPAMLALLDAGTGLTLVNRSGKLRGRLRPAKGGNLPLRRLQYARTQDEPFCLKVSREIVFGKIANTRTLAMRILRKRRAAGDSQIGTLAIQLARLTEAHRKAGEAQSLDTLRGLEGTAARAYFAILRAGVQWEGEQAFEKRVRRPPKDPVNALLSFGYTLLTEALMTAAEVAGLDPYAGFFHAEKYGRPALALDLVEEFRPLIADSVALTLVNKKMLCPRDFETDGQGVYLSRRGLKVFFKQFSARLNTKIFHPAAGRAISYQKCLEVQARQLRQVIEGKAEAYAPFIVK